MERTWDQYDGVMVSLGGPWGRPTICILAAPRSAAEEQPAKSMWPRNQDEQKEERKVAEIC